MQKRFLTRVGHAAERSEKPEIKSWQKAFAFVALLAIPAVCIAWL